MADVGRTDGDGPLELSLELTVTPLDRLYQRHVGPTGSSSRSSPMLTNGRKQRPR